MALPTPFICDKIGAPLFLGSILIIWGFTATLFAFMTRSWHFFVLRFLLGVTESGAYPGTTQFHGKQINLIAVSDIMPQILLHLFLCGSCTKHFVTSCVSLIHKLKIGWFDLSIPLLSVLGLPHLAGFSWYVSLLSSKSCCCRGTGALYDPVADLQACGITLRCSTRTRSWVWHTPLCLQPVP